MLHDTMTLQICTDTKRRTLKVIITCITENSLMSNVKRENSFGGLNNAPVGTDEATHLLTPTKQRTCWHQRSDAPVGTDEATHLLTPTKQRTCWQRYTVLLDCMQEKSHTSGYPFCRAVLTSTSVLNERMTAMQSN